MKSHTERLINLVAYLLNSRVSVSWEIIRKQMQGYEKASDSTALRMFERDKAELKEIGVPISYDGEGYSISKEHYYLPELNLTPDEMFLLQICSQSLKKTPGFNRIPEVTSVVHKAMFDACDLFPSDYAQAMEKNYILNFSLGTDTEKVSKLVKTLFDAIFKRKCVFMQYYSIGEDKKGSRTVEPYSLLIRKGIWYLVGKDIAKKDMRVYKLIRISKISVNKKSPEKPDFTVPKDFKIKDYLGKRAWELSNTDGTIEVKVKYSSDISWWVKENFSDRNEVQMNSDGSCIIKFKVNTIDSLIRWIMRIGEKAEILSPKYVRDEIKNAFTEILKKY
ncbi:MAG: WYL domain-containing protein [Candidatus Firestonebacteria bacterium]